MTSGITRFPLTLGLVFALSACSSPAERTGPTAPTPAIANKPAPPEASPKREPLPSDAIAAKVKELWLGLPDSRESCGDFDYHPQGGLKSFACHLELAENFSWLPKASGLSPFKAGPHSEQALDLQNPFDFGRYDPRFVRWLVDNIVPAASEPAFREKTQAIYESNVRPLAKTFLATYEKFAADPTCLESEVERYKMLLESSTGVPEGDYERFYHFMSPDFCRNPQTSNSPGQFNGNVVKTCVAFWVRRTVDGTAEDFYEGLKKLIDIYEPHAP